MPAIEMIHKESCHPQIVLAPRPTIHTIFVNYTPNLKAHILLLTFIMDKVEVHLGDIERKLGKIMKISEKGRDKMTIKDMVKVVSKGNSIVKTNDKMMKEYSVSFPLRGSGDRSTSS